jgi:hypothetical protein
MTQTDTHWLNRQRLVVYPGTVALAFICWIIYGLVNAQNGVDPAGNPLGYDFIQFWSVSHIGLHEAPVLAYDVQHLTAVEKTIAPAQVGILPWRYPPTFYLMVLPLALAPMWFAWAGFMLGTLALYVWAFRRTIQIPLALLCLAGFGPLWYNLLGGQTGFLTASLAAGGLLCLDKRPIRAGVLIGLLAIKPHLALLFPLCLIAIGAWRAFFAAAVTVVVFVLASLAVLGGDTLMGFLHGLGEAQHLLEIGRSPLAKMPSIFVSLRLLNVPATPAYVAHGVVALLAAWVVWRIWRRCADARLRNAALMTGSMFISPYIFDYDMVWLAFPVAWLVLYCLENGWLRFERELLALCWATTLFIAVVSMHTISHIAPIALGMLLWFIYRHTVPRLPQSEVGPETCRGLRDDGSS